jgi:hypothetical protein
LAGSARPIALTYALVGANAPMSSGDTFDLSVDVGNILTVATILVSVTVVLMSLAKDRRIREREIADKVRGAAARTLAKLERWQELSISYYENVRPGFEETSRMLATEFDVEQARDFLWKNLETARVDSLQRLRDEDIETAYVDLYAFSVSAYDRFRVTIGKLRSVDEQFHRQLRIKAQDDVLFWKGVDPAFYDPAALGNALRSTSSHLKSELDQSMTSEITPLREALTQIIAMDDRSVLRHRGQPLLPVSQS